MAEPLASWFAKYQEGFFLDKRAEGLSENTVKSHISHIFGKLGVQSRAEAVAAALQRGVVPITRP